MDKRKPLKDQADKRPARREFLSLAVAAGADLALAPLFRANRNQEMLVYVGTYTTGKSEGIYLYRLDLSSGELKQVAITRRVVNPSYLTLSPNRRFLYAVNEVGDFAGKKSGAISAFAVDQSTGELRLLNQRASLGADPCYVEVDNRGKFVLVANYTGGNVAVFRIERDGTLGPETDLKQDEGSSVNRERQEGPHAHYIALDATNRFAYSCDLGTDKIMIFRFDSRSGKLSAANQPWVQVKPGAGPRHLAFHPNGRCLFVLNELHSTVTYFTRDPGEGRLEERQTLSTLPNDFTGTNTAAEIEVSKDGHFLYSSNRGHDSIAIFAISPRDGSLNSIGYESTQGRTPRNFAIDPTGKFLLVANQNSNNIVVFRVDQKTGQLSSAKQTAEVPTPVCLKFTNPFS